MVRIIGHILLGVFLFLLLAAVGGFFFSAGCFVCRAHARDNGQYANTDPAIREWVRGLKDKNGQGCCDTADGYPAEAEYDTAGNHYRVRIAGAWYDVPDSALIDKPNRLGYPMVWYWRVSETDPPTIRCFIPGAGG